MSFKKLGVHYSKILTKHPILVQSLQTGILMATGDLLAQTVVESKTLEQIQIKRTFQFAVLGTCYVGPVCAAWYKILAKIFSETTRTTALKKVVCDQLIFSPCSTVACLTILNILKGKEFKQTKKELNAIFLDIMLSNYKLWPAVQVVNFYFVPLNYQVLFVQVVALLWNTYFSWKVEQGGKVI